MHNIKPASKVEPLNSKVKACDECVNSVLSRCIKSIYREVNKR